MIIDERYEILSELGEGGMAMVYEGLDRRLNRRVAVKILHRQFADSPELTQRFHQEAAIAARLEHFHVVQVYDFGTTDDGRAYIVSELVRGIDLHRLQEKHKEKTNGPLPIPFSLAVLDQALRGLGAVHAHNYVHRDVKPDNILISYEGAAKITDFGVAKDESQRLTTVGRFLGSPVYAAPEQVEGVPVDQRADVFAFGIILYEALTGVLPFDGNNAADVMKKIVLGTFRSPQALNPDIDLELVAVISKALKTSPDDRYASVGELQEALAPVMRAYGLKGEPAEVALFFREPDQFVLKHQRTMARGDLAKTRVRAQPTSDDRSKRPEALRPRGGPTQQKRTSRPANGSGKGSSEGRSVPRNTLPQAPRPRTLLWTLVAVATVLLVTAASLFAAERAGLWSARKVVAAWTATPLPTRIPTALPTPQATVLATVQATLVPTPPPTPQPTHVPVEATRAPTQVPVRVTPRPTVQTMQLRETEMGVLSFQTIPPGVPVFIDGEQRVALGAEASGPFRFDVKAGMHVVRVGSAEVGGLRYVGAEHLVKVMPGTVRDLGVIKLRPLRTLTLMIRGPGVVARVNNDRYALSRGPLVLSIPEGKVLIEAKASNGKSLRRTILLSGEDFTFNTSLE